MKNLIFVALLVSVMLVLSVGSAFAFDKGDYYPADRSAESGSTVSGGEAGGGSGGSGGAVVVTATEEIARFDDSALSLRGIE